MVFEGLDRFLCCCCPAAQLPPPQLCHGARGRRCRPCLHPDLPHTPKQCLYIRIRLPKSRAFRRSWSMDSSRTLDLTSGLTPRFAGRLGARWPGSTSGTTTRAWRMSLGGTAHPPMLQLESYHAPNEDCVYDCCKVVAVAKMSPSARASGDSSEQSGFPTASFLEICGL